MISNIQALRGLAALAVVFYHTAFTFNGGVHTDFQAVSVFFVISGFIMTYITRAESDQFLRQRLVRIVPLLACIGHTGGIWLLKESGRTGKTPGSRMSSRACFRPLPGRSRPDRTHSRRVDAEPEMFFYMLFAVTLDQQTLGPASDLPRLVAFKFLPQFSCSALLCAFYAHDYTAFLIFGILSYYIWRGIEALAGEWPLVAAPIGLLSAFVFVLWNAHPPFAEALQQRAGFPLYYTMPPLLVLAALTLHSARLSCRWKAVLLLGDASYALYLTHIMVMGFATLLRNRAIGDQVAAINPSQSVVAMLGALVVCSLVAIAVHLGVERPTLRVLRRRLIKRSEPSKLPDPRP